MTDSFASALRPCLLLASPSIVDPSVSRGCSTRGSAGRGGFGKSALHILSIGILLGYLGKTWDHLGWIPTEGKVSPGGRTRRERSRPQGRGRFFSAWWPPLFAPIAPGIAFEAFVTKNFRDSVEMYHIEHHSTIAGGAPHFSVNKEIST